MRADGSLPRAVTVGRRGLIRTVLLTLAAVPGPFRGARSLLGGSAAEAAPSAGRLSAADMEDLLAFAEIVVQGRAFERAERDALAAEIETRTTLDDESLSLYRTTVTVLRLLARRRFSTLDAPARAALVARHRLDSRSVDPDDDLGPFGDDVRVVRTRAVRSLIGAYYGSPAGWAVVRYATFPGRCGDLTRYTRAER